MLESKAVAPHMNTVANRRLVELAIAGCAVVMGLLVATPYAPVAAMGIAALLVVGAFSLRYGIVVPMILLTLAAVDGLPGPKLASAALPGGLLITDCANVLLIVVLVIANVQRGFPLAASRVGRWAMVWGGTLVVWWTFTLLRTETAVPIPSAAHFGRDYLFFALLLPLFVGAFMDRTLRDRFLIGTAVLIVPSAIGVILASANIVYLPWLVHSILDVPTNGITRVYPLVLELVTAALPLALGAIVLGQDPRLRRAGWIVFTLVAIDIAVTLGRVRSIGMLVGCLAAGLWWRRVGHAGERIVKAVALGGLVLALLVVTFPGSTVETTTTAVGDRFTSAFTDYSRRNSDTGLNTLAVRERARTSLKSQLDDTSWVFGLGFRDPGSVWTVNANRGSIRSGDLGWLGGVVTTMGLVGMLLIYLPIVGAAYVFASGRQIVERRDSWLMFGGLVYCIYLVATSNTLIVLFSTQGVIATSASVGAGLGVIAACQVRQRGKDSSTPPRALLGPRDHPASTSSPA